MCNKELFIILLLNLVCLELSEGLYYFALVTCSTMLPLLLKKLVINSH